MSLEIGKNLTSSLLVIVFVLLGNSCNGEHNSHPHQSDAQLIASFHRRLFKQLGLQPSVSVAVDRESKQVTRIELTASGFAWNHGGPAQGGTSKGYMYTLIAPEDIRDELDSISSRYGPLGSEPHTSSRGTDPEGVRIGGTRHLRETGICGRPQSPTKFAARTSAPIRRPCTGELLP